MNGIHCAFQGRLGGDAEYKTVRGDLALCSFSVAVDEGENRETQWIKMAVFGEKAEDHAGLRKGDKVYCEGYLKLNQWQSRGDEQRSGLNVSAWLVQPLGKIGKKKAARKKPKPKEIEDSVPFDDDLSHLGE